MAAADTAKTKIHGSGEVLFSEGNILSLRQAYVMFTLLMATLGYLICVKCKERMCAGKWLRSESDEGFGFWRGGLSKEQSAIKILHFLARHMNHDIRVLTEMFDRTEDYSDYRDVEDDLDGVNPDDKTKPPNSN